MCFHCNNTVIMSPRACTEWKRISYFLLMDNYFPLFNHFIGSYIYLIYRKYLNNNCVCLSDLYATFYATKNTHFSCLRWNKNIILLFENIISFKCNINVALPWYPITNGRIALIAECWEDFNPEMWSIRVKWIDIMDILCLSEYWVRPTDCFLYNLIILRWRRDDVTSPESQCAYLTPCCKNITVLGAELYWW